jgi:hypothetical protein
MTRPLRRGIFSKIALAVGALVRAAQVKAEDLYSRVLALRGDWR